MNVILREAALHEVIRSLRIQSEYFVLCSTLNVIIIFKKREFKRLNDYLRTPIINFKSVLVFKSIRHHNVIWITKTCVTKYYFRIVIDECIKECWKRNYDIW